MSLLSGHSQTQNAYEPTLWANLFHSAPHVNITFHPVDSRFNPESDLYLEALGILASIPAAWLITTLVILLIYLCTRCCDTKNTKKRRSRPIRCFLSFLALATCATLALGIWGTFAMNEGMIKFQASTMNINNIVERSQDMAEKYNHVFQNEIEKNLNLLYDGPFSREIVQDRSAHLMIMDSCEIVFNNISTGLEAMDQLRFSIQEPKDRMSFQHVPHWAASFEKYRFPGYFGIQALFGLFCLLLFVGAIVHSRCVLILFSVCGLFSIIMLWLFASIYTAVTVALADFCNDPTPWVQHVLSSSLDEEVTSYYLQCAAGQPNPYESFLSRSQRAILDIDHRVQIISGTARKYYSAMELSPHLDDLKQHTEDTKRLMSDLSMSLRCDPIFRSYNTALVGLCDRGLFGLILMLISASLSGVLFTILVWCNSHTWIYFKHKGRYIKVDDQDPYMPLSTIERPRLTAPPSGLGGPSLGSTPGYRRNMHTPPQTPSYHGTLNGSSHAGTIRSNMPTHQPMSAGVPAGGSIGYSHLNHLSGHHAGTLGHYGTHSGHRANTGMSTLGRNTQVTQSHGGYQGLDNLPATMTLGRRGHYASGRASKIQGGDNDAPLLGPNMGQYATLSKQCKTLECSDFY
ncbi:protein tweety-like [Tigriopus californicus]|uniref:protein tweety-like n=1 Tax=Tigriopus californicus TaxID=6832 RepID=UPI0027D9D697|nr:protein tweety-like [Tigriopus californicus]